VDATAPTHKMLGTALEADELSQNAGEQKHAPSRPHGSAPPARESAQGARHRCERSSAHHQHHLPRPRRAAVWGGRPRGQADVS
jgi:hypothetical protein